MTILAWMNETTVLLDSSLTKFSLTENWEEIYGEFRCYLSEQFRKIRCNYAVYAEILKNAYVYLYGTCIITTRGNAIDTIIGNEPCMLLPSHVSQLIKLLHASTLVEYLFAFCISWCHQRFFWSHIGIFAVPIQICTTH